MSRRGYLSPVARRSASELMRAGLRLPEEQEGDVAPDAGPLDMAAVRSEAHARLDD